MEPFRIVANIYYVGTADLGCYLIATPEGHILIDAGLPETPARIRASVAKLGFRLEDIKVQLGTHAHAEHAGGLAELEPATGARLYVGAADAAQFAAGGKGDFHWGDRLPFPPVVAEELL
ncbi:MAG: MBL fold metallo-hydrolase [Opitutaceae bacterium]